MIIPILVVKLKLDENALALCSFISHPHHVVLCLVSYFSSFAITQTLISPLLEIKGSFTYSLVILDRILSSNAAGRLSVGSISLFQN
jgi:hypothetical protein